MDAPAETRIIRAVSGHAIGKKEATRLQYVRLVATALVSAAVLYLLTKLMGKKQISQLSLFDYVTGITIGSIAAEMATELEDPVRPLIAMAVYGITAFLISVIGSKSIRARKLLNGTPLLLMRGGELFRDNLKKSHLDLSEFLAYCRISGYFDLSQIDTAVLEQNGTVSFLPVSGARPATPDDMGLSPDHASLPVSVVMDGHLLRANLALTGHSEDWLRNRLRAQGYGKFADVFFAVVNEKGEVSAYAMINRRVAENRLE